jgi:hypothetical protein
MYFGKEEAYGSLILIMISDDEFVRYNVLSLKHIYFINLANMEATICNNRLLQHKTSIL